MTSRLEKHITKLHDRPHSQRKSLALTVSLLVTVLIGVIWVSNFGDRLGGQTAAVYESDGFDVEKDSPLDTVMKQLGLSKDEEGELVPVISTLEETGEDQVTE